MRRSVAPSIRSTLAASARQGSGSRTRYRRSRLYIQEWAVHLPDSICDNIVPPATRPGRLPFIRDSLCDNRVATVLGVVTARPTPSTQVHDIGLVMDAADFSWCATSPFVCWHALCEHRTFYSARVYCVLCVCFLHEHTLNLALRVNTSHPCSDSVL